MPRPAHQRQSGYPPRALLALLLALLAACHETETPTGIHLVGLDHSSCEGGPLLFGTISLLAVAEGPGEFSSVTFMIENMEPEIDNDPPFELLFEPLDDGPVEIGVTGIDFTGETKSTSLIICVDNNGPLLTVKKPPARISVEDRELAIEVTEAQDGRPIQRVSASLDIAGVHQEVDCSPLEQPVCPLRPSEMGVVLEPDQEVPGEVTVTARDAAGHERVVTYPITAWTHLRWKRYVGGNLAWAPLLLPGQRLAVGSTNGFIQLISLEEGRAGKELCTYQMPTTSAVRPGVTYQGMNQLVTPLVSDSGGTLLTFATSKAAWALNLDQEKSTCTLRWRHELVPPPESGDPKNQEYPKESGLALDEEHGLIFIAKYNGDASPVRLEALSAATGQEVDSIDVGEELGGDLEVPVNLSPVLSADGGTLYVGRRGLFSLDVSPLRSEPAGKMQYNAGFAPEGGVNFSAPPLLLGELIYLSGWDGKVYALRASDLREAVSFSFTQVQGKFTSSVAASADGQTLFAANGENANLYAFDASSGTSEGELFVGKAPTAPPVPGPGGTIYLSTLYPAEQTQLSAVAFPEMSLRWAFAPQGHDDFQAAPVIDQGTLYVGNNNGYLYALDVSDDGP